MEDPAAEERDDEYPEPCLRAETHLRAAERLQEELAELNDELRRTKPENIDPAFVDRLGSTEAEYARHGRDLDILRPLCADLLSQKLATERPGGIPPSGQWIVQDGEMTCDGYLVRDFDKDYCADELPEDWVPRMFDGEVYYVLPLGAEGGFLHGSAP